MKKSALLLVMLFLSPSVFAQNGPSVIDELVVDSGKPESIAIHYSDLSVAELKSALAKPLQVDLRKLKAPSYFSQPEEAGFGGRAESLTLDLSKKSLSITRRMMVSQQVDADDLEEMVEVLGKEEAAIFTANRVSITERANKCQVIESTGQFFNQNRRLIHSGRIYLLCDVQKKVVSADNGHSLPKLTKMFAGIGSTSSWGRMDKVLLEIKGGVYELSRRGARDTVLMIGSFESTNLDESIRALKAVKEKRPVDAENLRYWQNLVHIEAPAAKAVEALKRSSGDDSDIADSLGIGLRLKIK